MIDSEGNDAPARPIGDRATEEARVLSAVIEGVASLPPDARPRILAAVATFFGLTEAAQPVRASTSSERSEVRSHTPFSVRSDISPKQFMVDKQPHTDVERVACLAYYLTHFRDTPFFKTLDISMLNTEAAQPKFSNAAYAVDNAGKQGYLVQATKGNKQLSAAGEQFVQALPDRESARALLERSRPRRSSRNRKTSSESSGEQEL